MKSMFREQRNPASAGQYFEPPDPRALKQHLLLMLQRVGLSSYAARSRVEHRGNAAARASRSRLSSRQCEGALRSGERSSQLNLRSRRRHRSGTLLHDRLSEKRRKDGGRGWKLLDLRLSSQSCDLRNYIQVQVL